MGRTKNDETEHAIENMSCEHVMAVPVDYDWSAINQNEDGERSYEWAERVGCPGCNQDVVAVNGEIQDHVVGYRDEDGNDITPAPGHEDDYDGVPCTHNERHSDSAEGPMMSYYYPCRFPGSMAEAAAAISGNLCAVTLADGTEALALTGGGMDMSWDICAAYLDLGCLPPLHFAGDLPKMGGMKLTERTDRVLRGALRSAQVASRWASEAADKVRRMRAELVAEAGKTTPKRRRAGGRK